MGFADANAAKAWYLSSRRGRWVQLVPLLSKVRPPEANDDGSWRILFDKEDAPAQMDGVTAAVLDAIEGMDDVDYDGWG